jgi:protein subunit release factor A
MKGINDEHGVLGILFGLVLLVLLGVTMGVLKDHRLGFSSRRSINLKDIETDAAYLAGLSREVEQLTSKEESLRKVSQATANDWDVSRQRLAETESALREKKMQVPQLDSELALLEKEYATYRQLQLESVRNAAVGEEIGILTTNSGRVYEKAVIKMVTDKGMEISHQHGLSRIDANNLGPAWHTRFRWHDK